MMLLHPNADLMASIGDRCVYDFDKLARQVCLTVGDEDNIVFARSESPISNEAESTNEPAKRHVNRKASRRLDDFDKLDNLSSRRGSDKLDVYIQHGSESDQKDEEPPEEPRADVPAQ